MAALAQKEETDPILYTSPSCSETFPVNICCYDTETTALNTSKAKIIELALQDISGNNKFT